MSASPSYQNLRLETKDRLVIVTIARPAVLNALDALTMRELGDLFLSISRQEELRAIILTGAGEKAFVAGADITELASLGPAQAAALSARGQALFSLIESCGKPVIAAVNGFALGAGCELAMACTLRIASETARFGQPEAKLGLIPGYGGTQRLARLVGKGRALELILSGEMIDAAEALRIGLVNHTVPPPELLPRAESLAAMIAANAPLAIRYAMQAVHQGLEMPLAEAMAHEAALFGLVCATEDKNEGTRAFLEKRPPQFKGQ
jgi:enoyl-CoA hydratase